MQYFSDVNDKVSKSKVKTGLPPDTRAKCKAAGDKWTWQSLGGYCWWEEKEEEEKGFFVPGVLRTKEECLNDGGNWQSDGRCKLPDNYYNEDELTEEELFGSDPSPLSKGVLLPQIPDNVDKEESPQPSQIARMKTECKRGGGFFRRPKVPCETPPQYSRTERMKQDCLDTGGEWLGDGMCDHPDECTEAGMQWKDGHCIDPLDTANQKPGTTQDSVPTPTPISDPLFKNDPVGRILNGLVDAEKEAIGDITVLRFKREEDWR